MQGHAGLSRGLDTLHEGERTNRDEMIDTNVRDMFVVTRR